MCENPGVFSCCAWSDVMILVESQSTIDIRSLFGGLSCFEDISSECFFCQTSSLFLGREKIFLLQSLTESIGTLWVAVMYRN